MKAIKALFKASVGQIQPSKRQCPGRARDDLPRSGSITRQPGGVAIRVFAQPRYAS